MSARRKCRPDGSVQSVGDRQRQNPPAATPPDLRPNPTSHPQVGVDSDPLAVRSAAFNAGLNGYTSSLPPPSPTTPTSLPSSTPAPVSAFASYLCGTSLEDPEPMVQAGCSPVDVEHAFDVVVANILRGESARYERAPRFSYLCALHCT